jgi:Rnl2 family RNA ligase
MTDTFFVKWPSIENSYRKKYINWFLEQYPDLANEDYVITEKIHGANLQIVIRPDAPLLAGSRNNYIDANGSFQGALLSDVLEEHEETIRIIQDYADRTGDTIRLYGELFGKGIQKGVNYGPRKRLRFFGVRVNEQLISYQNTGLRFISSVHLVPTVGFVQGLEAALAFDAGFNSHYSDEDENICEGVVIRPYARDYFDGHGSPFMLKKKNEVFLERAKAKKIIVVDTEVEQLRAEFQRYITEARLQSVFSKHGVIEAPAQMGDYIRLVLADAKEDFIKDFGDKAELLDKKQRRAVYNVGGTIANMLKENL